ncbi:HTH-type transcriptional regulator DegA [compost metagenome]
MSVGQSSNSKDRLDGYSKALEDHGIPFNSQWVKYCENTEGDGYIKAVELLSGNKLSALFCSTDMLALGAVRGAKMLGYGVPGDLSIGGFDGLGFHLLTEPKITTIRQPVYLVGQKLAEALITIVNGKPSKQVNMLIKPELVVEHSVIPRRIELS